MLAFRILLFLIATGVNSTRTTMAFFNSSSYVDVLVYPGWGEAVWSAKKVKNRTERNRKTEVETCPSGQFL